MENKSSVPTTLKLRVLSSVNAILSPHGIIRLSNEELLKVILYGHKQLSFDSNAKILTATLEYIHTSKRGSEWPSIIIFSSPLPIFSFCLIVLFKFLLRYSSGRTSKWSMCHKLCTNYDFNLVFDQRGTIKARGVVMIFCTPCYRPCSIVK